MPYEDKSPFLCLPALSTCFAKGDEQCMIFKFSCTEMRSSLNVPMKNVLGKKDIFMQLCTDSLCKFQCKIFVSCKTDHCSMRECFLLVLVIFCLLQHCIILLYSLFLCANDMTVKMKTISHVGKKSGF